MHALLLLVAAAMTADIAYAAPRFAVYIDEWHEPTSYDKNVLASITHVITAFAESALFFDGTGYVPSASFLLPSNLRNNFDQDVKICMAIGGWGDDSLGFTNGSQSDESRKAFAKNVESSLTTNGYDCVDIDWEYPGGNGADYKQVGRENKDKVDEITNYPLLLQEIKKAIGDKELSIAVPGRAEDMIAFTNEQVPKISDAVDVVNVMAYDLMNRRDNMTKHHASVQGVNQTIQTYLDRGMDAAKMNLGFPFYAKFFNLAGTCDTPIGCPTKLMEDPNTGADLGTSGAAVFALNDDFSVDWQAASAKGQADNVQGGQWCVSNAKGISSFWTWDTPEFIAEKFSTIVKPMKLGGVMAWSLGEDDPSFTYVQALNKGLQTLGQ
ncbi:glycoside hydrolase family 18 protein [Xylariaceae sp. FL0016]|nr:glycoside hydrolase family 18 protein [Xylariaceae sp. FL0016]